MSRKDDNRSGRLGKVGRWLVGRWEGSLLKRWERWEDS